LNDTLRDIQGFCGHGHVFTIREYKVDCREGKKVSVIDSLIDPDPIQTKIENMEKEESNFKN